MKPFQGSSSKLPLSNISFYAIIKKSDIESSCYPAVFPGIRFKKASFYEDFRKRRLLLLGKLIKNQPVQREPGLDARLPVDGGDMMP